MTVEYALSVFAAAIALVVICAIVNWKIDSAVYDRPWWGVSVWPRWLRRIFICTFPVSGPLWLTCVIVGGFIFYCGVVPIAIFNTLVGNYWDDPPVCNANHEN